MNKFSPLVCKIKSDETPGEVTVTNNNYSSCFTNNDEKYIEIDKQSKKCKIYNTINCDNQNDGNLLTSSR